MKKHFILCMAFAFVSSVSSAGKLIPPAVTDASIEMGSATMDEVDLKLKLEVENPNSEDVKIEKLKADVTVDGIAPIKVASDQVITLKARSKTNYAVPLKLPWKSALFLSGKVLEKEDVAYKVKGTAKIGGKEVPFDHKGKLPVK